MNDRLRIGDAERAAAAVDLNEHYVQGRLTSEEHDERVGRIWAARTQGDLDPLFVDLPALHVDPAASAHPVTPARPARRWSVPIMVVLGALVLLTLLTHLPVFLIGLLAFWLVAHRQGRRHHQWHRRRY